MKRVLVTGAAGFIGSHLCLQLNKRRDIEVLPYTDDCTDIEQVIADFKQARPNIIVHLANIVGPKRWAEHSEDCLRNNLQADLAVKAAAKACSSKPRVFYASSSEIYLDSDEPLTEDSPVGLREGPRSGYAMAKLVGERLFDVNLRLFNVVGGGQSRGFALPDMLHDLKTKNMVRASRDIRTLTHVDDVVDTIIAMIVEDAPDGVYNVADPENEVTMVEVADALIENDVAFATSFGNGLCLNRIDIECECEPEDKPRIELYDDGYQPVKRVAPTKAMMMEYHTPTRGLKNIISDVMRAARAADAVR